jgi:hypothetical protein
MRWVTAAREEGLLPASSSAPMTAEQARRLIAQLTAWADEQEGRT